VTPAPAPGEIPARTHLLPALGFVLVGLLGRALIDKALVLRGGAELVAHWAQLGSLVDSVAGVALAGIGIGLTGRVAAVAPSRQRRLLGDAVRLGLLLSGACLLLAAGLAAGRLAAAPAATAGRTAAAGTGRRLACGRAGHAHRLAARLRPAGPRHRGCFALPGGDRCWPCALPRRAANWRRCSAPRPRWASS
jgi:hypothetical protein